MWSKRPISNTQHSSNPSDTSDSIFCECNALFLRRGGGETAEPASCSSWLVLWSLCSLGERGKTCLLAETGLPAEICLLAFPVLEIKDARRMENTSALLSLQLMNQAPLIILFWLLHSWKVVTSNRLYCRIRRISKALRWNRSSKTAPSDIFYWVKVGKKFEIYPLLQIFFFLPSLLFHSVCCLYFFFSFLSSRDTSPLLSWCSLLGTTDSFLSI